MDDFASLLVGMTATSLLMIVMSFATFRQITTPAYGSPFQAPELLGSAPFPQAPQVDSPYAFANALQRST